MRFANKKGYTLIEVLAVVAILGILSSMGYAGLQSAVENRRVHAAAVTTTAFLNQVATEARRLSTPLCLKKVGDQRIEVYVGDNCQTVTDDAILSFELEAPMKFTDCHSFDCDSDEGCGVNWLNGTSGVFRPRIGLSSTPVSGHVCSQYGSEAHYAASLKRNTENFIRSMIGFVEDGDTEIDWE